MQANQQQNNPPPHKFKHTNKHSNQTKKDFVFCKEVRLGSYSANAPVLPPAAVVAARAMAADPRAEPRCVFVLGGGGSVEEVRVVS
jgi:hypothetical protein